MDAKYPRIHAISRKPRSGGACENCGDKAIAVIRVAYSFMRGDDEQYFACAACERRAKVSLRGFLRSVGKRYDHISGMSQ